ncbi:UNVERIFIED_CONTAM: hypothetical protein LK11_54550 [Mumia flava]
MLVGGVLSAALVLAGCSGAADAGLGSSDDPETSPTPTSAPDVVLSSNVDDGARDVAVDTEVSLAAENGTITAVTAHFGKKAKPKRTVQGEISSDGASWTADGTLEPGKKYRLEVTTRDEDGATETVQRTFRTTDLRLDQQAYASISPLDGQTVGVAMPIIVRFDIPVTRRAEVERHLEVSSKPQVNGTWSWVSDSEVHFRPRKYWPAGTDVDVNVNINSLKTAKGIYGQMDRSTSFQITDQAVTSVVDVANHTLTVKVDGKVARTIPATTGKAGFETRNGTKVIMEKHLEKRMDAATTGISEDDPEYYNISDVKYAMRVTNSGEFVHAAPWSVGSQGSANVSHGCTGLSVENAQWYYGISTIGDPVKFVNSSRTVLEPQNGWTDWNISYKEFKKGSALS